MMKEVKFFETKIYVKVDSLSEEGINFRYSASLSGGGVFSGLISDSWDGDMKKRLKAQIIEDLKFEGEDARFYFVWM